jgi:endonuclease/exonuclease/phosphatase family metal-dependent hydrolase
MNAGSITKMNVHIKFIIFIGGCKYLSMKISYLLCLAVLVFSNTSAQKPLNIMTFNIRYDNASDSMNAWSYRKSKVVSQILFYEADIIAVQEALHNQMLDLEQSLMGYRYTGFGRDDGKTKGEYSAIFYNSNRLELLNSATFWLSETPGIAGSKSWDAAITRIVSWAKFRDKVTRKIFFHFNTHFDHIGKIARKESAKILLNAVDSIAGKKNLAMVTGDFNAYPWDEPIRILTARDNVLHLFDSKDLSIMAHYGPTGTFNGFGTKEMHNDPIDYIFFNNRVKVLKHATLSESWQGLFSSDHFPVLVSLLL